MNSIKYQKKLTQAKTNKRIKAVSRGKMNQSTCPTSSEGYLLLEDEIFAAAVLQNNIHCEIVHRRYLENQNEERKKISRLDFTLSSVKQKWPPFLRFITW